MISKTQHQHVYLFLVIITLIVYGQTLNHEFLNMDTLGYITLNPHVASGLSLANLHWAITEFHISNWHPVTWISHMLDVEIFGLNPGAHHAVNVSFHLVNVLMLFYIFNRLTHQIWPSAMIAALFAIHPTHVESVAWVAERKDVLSMLFLLLAINSYSRFIEARSIFQYCLMLLFTSLGLMAKPMLVTLPFILLLLDYWPLNRQGSEHPGLANYIRALPRLCFEKTPLFILSALSCWITLLAQSTGGAMQPGSHLDLFDRLCNAAIAYVGYVRKTLAPLDLSFFYPHPGQWPDVTIVSSTIVLIAICCLCVYWSKKHPYLFVGWAIFVGALVPVIGLIQVGAQASADRYTYIPSIGLYICLTFGLKDLFSFFSLRSSIITFAMAATLSLLTAISWQYVGYWKNSVSLWSYSLASVDKQYPIILGIEAGEVDRSERLLGLSKPYFLLGRALQDLQLWDAALIHLEEAQHLNSENPATYYNLGLVLAALGERQRALAAFDKVTELDPTNSQAKKDMDVVRQYLKQQSLN